MDNTAATLDTSLGVITVTGPGPFSIRLPNTKDTPPTEFWDTKHVSSSANSLSILRLDPIVASVRISATSSLDSKTQPDTVSVEILSGIFYLEQKTEVTLSVILTDGRRLLITNPDEIKLMSSNTTAMTVDSNFVIGHTNGRVKLTVSWVVCNKILASEVIDVVVTFDQHRPEFNPTQANTTVPEDAQIGYLVYTVNATDQDVLDVHTDDILYNLVDSYGGKFTIDQETGEITVSGSLDREEVSKYILLVEATDQVQRDQLECQNQNIQPTVGPSTNNSNDGSGSGSDNVATPTLAPPPPSNGSCPGVSPISIFTVSSR